MRTREYITGTLRRILKFAYDRRLVDEAPPSGKRIGVKGPGNSNRRLRVITPEEAEAILFLLEKRDVRAWRLTRFAFLTGCRASEAFNLRWRDIDPVLGTLTFALTKNKDARRLPLTAPLRDLLGVRGDMESHVFTKSGGSPYTEAPAAFKTVVNDVLRLNDGRIALDRVSFHSIRHSVATNLAKQLNPRDLMDLLGWRTVQMAMRYVKGDEQTQAHALAGLEAALTARPAKVLPMRHTRSA
ncbi:MAG: tyrosine-type recombinase/integrase [Desulfovibrionaceae bacterium]